jgi:hypothetical protein
MWRSLLLKSPVYGICTTRGGECGIRHGKSNPPEGWFCFPRAKNPHFRSFTGGIAPAADSARAAYPGPRLLRSHFSSAALRRK